MGDNKHLIKAKKVKDDEFYTLYSDIERELIHYKNHFRDKIVYCNCDDASKSEFYNYFKNNFIDLGLKKLICTGFNPEPFQHGFGCTYENGTETFFDLYSNGSFDSPECIDFLDEADIVVTNPPFSLFQEYITLLIEHKKKFLIIGNNSAVKSKGVFSHIKNNEIWCGVTYRGLYFKRPNTEELAWVNANWFTNLQHNKRMKPLVLNKKYDPEKYPEYDNYKAIDVSKVADIPSDYYGIMGVPITFLDNYCPDQFDIIWHSDRYGEGHLDFLRKPDWHTYFNTPYLNGKNVFTRLFIKRK